MEQHHLAAALLEENLEDLYENAPCGYISTFPDGTFAKVNRTFLAWTNHEPEALLANTRFQDLLTVPGKIFYETHYFPLLHMQGFVRELAFDIRCADGRILPVFVNSVQHRDASNIPLLNRTTIFDASDRRQYERELQLARNKAEQALKLRDQFLALAAHELRTPVTSILGNIQLLQRRVHRENSLNVRDQRALQIASEQTIRLTKMIQSLLDISRIETGQLSIERAPVDISMLLYRLVDEMQATLDKREIDVRYLAQSAIIQGDELRLEQVFRNLLDNALKYGGPRGLVTVVIRQLETGVAVDIRDRGIGIPVDALSQLFERFYRASNVLEGRASGMGIGLYVVKEIVELHGGNITVESVEGQGSTFTVSFP